MTPGTSTEFTPSGNCPFLAYILSWWKIKPSLVRVGGALPPTFTISTITYKVVVYAPSETTDTLRLFLLYPYTVLWGYEARIFLSFLVHWLLIRCTVTSASFMYLMSDRLGCTKFCIGFLASRSFIISELFSVEHGSRDFFKNNPAAEDIVKPLRVMRESFFCDNS